jgi:hypothetical protein
MPTMVIRVAIAITLLLGLTTPMSVWATGPTLTVSAEGNIRTLDRNALLARPDVVEITTSRDVAYGIPRTYGAVALANLWKV